MAKGAFLYTSYSFLSSVFKYYVSATTTFRGLPLALGLHLETPTPWTQGGAVIQPIFNLIFLNGHTMTRVRQRNIRMRFHAGTVRYTDKEQR